LLICGGHSSEEKPDKMRSFVITTGIFNGQITVDGKEYNKGVKFVGCETDLYSLDIIQANGDGKYQNNIKIV
jgi:hypothetical protein